MYTHTTHTVHAGVFILLSYWNELFVYTCRVLLAKWGHLVHRGYLEKEFKDKRYRSPLWAAESSFWWVFESAVMWSVQSLFLNVSRLLKFPSLCSLTSVVDGNSRHKERCVLFSLLGSSLCNFITCPWCLQGEPGPQGIPGPRGPPGLGLQGDKVSLWFWHCMLNNYCNSKQHGNIFAQQLNQAKVKSKWNNPGKQVVRKLS